MGEELVWACKNGDLDQVKDIVDKPGFDVNAELLGGRNGLHFAADYGQREVIEFLLSKGANINVLVFRYLCHVSNIRDVPELPLKHPPEKERSLILHDKLPDKHGITALLASIFESQTECVKLLIEKGADFKRFKAPDGKSYFECAETDDIKSLLK